MTLSFSHKLVSAQMKDFKLYLYYINSNRQYNQGASSPQITDVLSKSRRQAERRSLFDYLSAVPF